MNKQAHFDCHEETRLFARPGRRTRHKTDRLRDRVRSSSRTMNSSKLARSESGPTPPSVEVSKRTFSLSFGAPKNLFKRNRPTNNRQLTNRRPHQYKRVPCSSAQNCLFSSQVGCPVFLTEMIRNKKTARDEPVSDKPPRRVSSRVLAYCFA